MIEVPYRICREVGFRTIQSIFKPPRKLDVHAKIEQCIMQYANILVQGQFNLHRFHDKENMCCVFIQCYMVGVSYPFHIHFTCLGLEAI